MEFGETRTFGSVSKTVAGAGNHLEVVVIGGKGSATWSFSSPDEIVIGSGRDRNVIARRDAEIGSKHAVGHGAGWLEGYIEIIRQLILDVTGSRELKGYPTLEEALRVTSPLLRAVGG
jgi:hypothetical protein